MGTTGIVHSEDFDRVYYFDYDAYPDNTIPMLLDIFDSVKNSDSVEDMITSFEMYLSDNSDSILNDTYVVDYDYEYYLEFGKNSFRIIIPVYDEEEVSEIRDIIKDKNNCNLKYRPNDDGYLLTIECKY